METNVPVAARALNVGCFQRLVESSAQGGNRIPPPAWTGEERLFRPGAEAPGCQRPAARQLLSQVRCNRNHSGLVKLGMPNMQQACVEVDIGLCESQKLSGPEAGKIQKAQGSAQDCVPNRR